MEAYRITDWAERYEVNTANGVFDPTNPKHTLRQGSLRFVRSKVHGRDQGIGFRRMRKLAGNENAYAVFGMFHKFLEIAALGPPGTRGALMNGQGQPSTIEDLAEIMEAPVDQVRHAMEILTDKRVGWVCGGGDGSPQKSTEVHGKPQRAIGDNGNQGNPTTSQVKIQVRTGQDRTNPSHDGDVKSNGDGSGHPAEEGIDLEISSEDDLDLDLKKAKMRFWLDLDKIFPRKQWTISETTTFRNLVKHIVSLGEPENFTKAIMLATAALNTPPGQAKPTFITYCKNKFGFVKTVGWQSDNAKRKAMV